MLVKAMTGKVLRLWWQSPAFLTEAPTVSVIDADGETLVDAEAMSPLRADVTIEDVDQRDLIADAALDGTLSGVTGPNRGLAWFETAAESTFDVLVEDLVVGDDGPPLVPGRLIIADDLPRGDIAGGTVQWRTWTYLLDAELTAEAVEHRLRFDWVGREGADAPTDAGRSWGTLRVADALFDTGLTHAHLVRRWPSLTDHLHRRATSFADQIEATLEAMLTDEVRPALMPYGLTEDALHLTGHNFRSAHAELTRAAILQDARLTLDAESAATEGQRLLRQALKAIKADLDGDGAAEDADVSGVKVPAVHFEGGGITDPTWDVTRWR